MSSNQVLTCQITEGVLGWKGQSPTCNLGKFDFFEKFRILCRNMVMLGLIKPHNLRIRIMSTHDTLIKTEPLGSRYNLYL